MIHGNLLNGHDPEKVRLQIPNSHSEAIVFSLVY
jgi:hypothetical protein